MSNRGERRYRFGVVLGCVLCWLLGIGHAAAQDKMELIQRLDELQKQLRSQKIQERDEAQAEILKLGPTVLDFLEIPDSDATSDLISRVATIRTALEKQAVAAVSRPSKVTLQGEMTIDDALAAIKKQTDNNVMITVEQVGLQKISLDLKDVSFWVAIDELNKKSGLAVDTFGGEPGVLALSPVPSIDPAAQFNPQVAPVPVSYAQIFRTAVTRIDSSVSLQQPGMDYTNISMLVRWEPRLRPISVDLAMADVAVKDEFGDPVRVADPQRVAYGMIQPELPEVEFSLRLQRVDRQIESLESINATISAVLPGRVETFRFKSLSEQKVGRAKTKAGATVTYGGVKKNEDVFMVKVQLSFGPENNALESHQGWVFQNEVFLENEKGEREESIGLETLQQGQDGVTIRYIFLEDPGLRTLVYKTPAAIVKLPINIQLKKVPLP